MDRSNPYEAAFESYLQHHQLGYVAVDESRRALVEDVPLLVTVAAWATTCAIVLALG